MADLSSFTGLVLAGGQSVRMGRDKALLKLPDGRTLIERAVSVLREAGAGEIIVSTGATRTYGLADTREVRDGWPDKGPLAGLVAGLSVATQDRVAVLAVDLPRMTTAFVTDLLSEATNQRGIIPLRGDRAEPLAAVYPRSACTLAEAALNAGRLSLQGWVRELQQAGLARFRVVADDETDLFSNWNSPEDCR